MSSCDCRKNDDYRLYKTTVSRDGNAVDGRRLRTVFIVPIKRDISMTRLRLGIADIVQNLVGRGRGGGRKLSDVLIKAFCFLPLTRLTRVGFAQRRRRPFNGITVENAELFRGRRRLSRTPTTMV